MDAAAVNYPEWIGLIGAFVAFTIGLRHYSVAQAWKRAEFMAAEAKAFFDDPKVATALLLIDYSVIRLNQQGVPSPKGAVFDDDILVRALALHTEFVDETERLCQQELQAREAFDSLFAGLERFDHYLQTKLIRIDDLQVHLGYWIDKLANSNSEWKKREFYAAVHQFVHLYGYHGVQHLFAAFKVGGPKN
jgi:hypothetical protein